MSPGTGSAVPGRAGRERRRALGHREQQGWTHRLLGEGTGMRTIKARVRGDGRQGWSCRSPSAAVHVVRLSKPIRRISAGRNTAALFDLSAEADQRACSDPCMRWPVTELAPLLWLKVARIVEAARGQLSLEEGARAVRRAPKTGHNLCSSPPPSFWSSPVIPRRFDHPHLPAQPSVTPA